jgi:hypothetical protein
VERPRSAPKTVGPARYEGNPVLESSLRACPIARLDPCAPAAFDAMEPSAFSLNPYDVIVLDRHAPRHLPRCCYLVLGAVPAGIDVNSPGELENQAIVDWRARIRCCNTRT